MSNAKFRLLIGLCVFACSEDPSSDNQAKATDGTSPEAMDGVKVLPGGSVGATSFRYGFNAGYPNPAFDDRDLAQLGKVAGATSQRISLPESHLERWGYSIELEDVKAYAAMGMGSFVGFLTSPIRAHSMAPASAADWELVHYLPSNLYEPILDATGAINAGNYWAAYVYKTVSTYGAWIKIWEIWNEPDWVSDWQVSEAWKARAPSAADLPRFHGSVFDYVRMLRVSAVAAKLADPEARIATGGIGYPNFLDAVLRYTDEPTAGVVDAEHPKTGADYLDVISFHHYPIYTSGDSEAGASSFVAQKRALEGVVAAHGRSYAWECTETGAPRLSIASFPGGVDYAREYLIKVMALGPSLGISGIHWFALSDAKDVTSTNDPYAAMGLYRPLAELAATSEARLTDTGVAFATLSSVLAGTSYDASRTGEWKSKLPADVTALCFRDSQEHTRVVLWSTRAEDTLETPRALALETTNEWLVFASDAAATGKAIRLVPNGGAVTISASRAPLLLVEQ